MIDYADLISLYSRFTPAQDPADLTQAAFAIAEDVGSGEFLRQNPMPDKQEKLRLWIRAALTLRPPGDLPVNLNQAMDKILQAELAAKLITHAEDLPRLDTDRYPCAAQFSIWDGDISTLRVDCITNAANT